MTPKFGHVFSNTELALINKTKFQLKKKKNNVSKRASQFLSFSFFSPTNRAHKDFTVRFIYIQPRFRHLSHSTYDHTPHNIARFIQRYIIFRSQDQARLLSTEACIRVEMCLHTSLVKGSYILADELIQEHQWWSETVANHGTACSIMQVNAESRTV